MYTVAKEKIIFKDIFQIEEAEISQQGQVFRRVKINKENAVAVLVYNVDTNKFILTRQLRYPIASQHPEPLLEILAGRIDYGENALETALRETEEEIGYKVNSNAMQFLFSCYPTPGYSSELFNLYAVKVSNSDKITSGGGLLSENEFIEVVEMSKESFFSQIKNGELKDGKTYLAALYVLLHPELGFA
jgi:nudix-type nucleoside diphosphatase (YffH/AdpP family)